MSNVKINGNTYNEVSAVRLPLADGTGYAVYSEGQSADENAFLDALIGGEACGDLVNESATKVNFGVFSYGNFGSLSFPNAVTCVSGKHTNITATNVFAPSVIKTAGAATTFASAKITGSLDLRSYIAATGNTSAYGSNAYLQYFVQSCTIGTLRIDAINGYRGNMFSSSTITNLVWGGADLVADNIKADLNSATAITNLYITDAIYDDVQSLISDGTITKVTNLYKYSEWSDA